MNQTQTDRLAELKDANHAPLNEAEQAEVKTLEAIKAGQPHQTPTR